MPLTKTRIQSSADADPGAPPPARERILDAADRALGRFGYRRMTIDDLARDAGIGKGTVYLSFRSKEEIALACIDRMAGRVLARMRALAAERTPAPERLRRMLVERVLLRFDYAHGHAASIDELLGAIRPALLERRQLHFEAEAAVVAGVLLTHAAAGAAAIPPAARRTAGETALAMILSGNALLPYSLGVREMGRRPEIARHADRIARLVLHGVFAGSSPEPVTQIPNPRKTS